MNAPGSPENRPMALIVSGAFETPHATATNRRYQGIGDIVLDGRALEDGLVMLDMGTPVHGIGPLFGCSAFEKIYDITAPILDRKIRDRESDEKVDLFGFSMGGVVVALYGHQNPDTVGTITAIAAPSKGIFGHLDMLSRFNTSLRSATNWVDLQRSTAPSEAPELNLIASESDEVVPFDLALSALATRKLAIRGHGSPTHLNITNHPTVLGFSQSVRDGTTNQYIESIHPHNLAPAA